VRQRDFYRIERKRDQVLSAVRKTSARGRSYGTSEDDLPLPPDNPEFDLFDPRFQKVVDAKFQAGIALAERNEILRRCDAETARGQRARRAVADAETRRETLDRARRRVR